jgi:DoxX-like family
MSFAAIRCLYLRNEFKEEAAMTTISPTAQVWIGRVLSGVAVLFLAMDATMKVLQLPVAVEGTKKLGYPAGVVLPLGIVQLVCLAAYLIPRTRVLGAILWTGYLGGAVATHVRVGDPLFSHILFPVYVAALLWGGLCLRDARLRAIVKGAR